MDKLLVGLGNPGKKYEATRHNAGFMLVDIISKNRTKFKFNKRFNSEIYRTEDVVIAKPQTYMNNSGEAVRALTAYYKLPIASLHIAHDDLDLRLGEYKIQKGVGPKDHKGVASIENALGTQEFWRIRIGIDNREPDRRIPGEDYVLMSFSKEELVKLENVLKDIVKQLDYAS